MGVVMITTPVRETTPICAVSLMRGSAVNNFIVKLFKFFQAKKFLKIGLSAVELCLAQIDRK